MRVFESPIKWQRDLPADHQDACPYVAGRYFRNVRNGSSPQWMQHRLLAIGLRPISALVDITNYVTYDLNRPLHVFDADKVAGDVTMRFATDGEEILALDGETYRLDPETVVFTSDSLVERTARKLGFVTVARVDALHTISLEGATLFTMEKEGVSSKSVTGPKKSSSIWIVWLPVYCASKLASWVRSSRLAAASNRRPAALLGAQRRFLCQACCTSCTSCGACGNATPISQHRAAALRQGWRPA